MMIWTVELAAFLDDAPWPATKDELLEYADRIGAPYEVIQNLDELEDNDDDDEEEEQLRPLPPPHTQEDIRFV